jgi:hypothetical protein
MLGIKQALLTAALPRLGSDGLLFLDCFGVVANFGNRSLNFIRRFSEALGPTTCQVSGKGHAVSRWLRRGRRQHGALMHWC